MEEELLAYFRRRFHADQDEFEAIRLLFGRLLVDPELKQQMQQIIRAPDRNFSKLIERLIEVGAVGDDSIDVDLLFRTVCVFSAAINFTTHHLLGVPEEVCDEMFQLISRSPGTELSGGNS